ncbi:MAG: 3-dehydroquinate synthase [Actinomycetota bacterium]
MTRTTIEVAVTPAYDVVVGRGVADALPDMLPNATRVAVVSSESVLPFAESALAALGKAGFEVHPLLVPDGESAKDIEVAQRVWAALGESGFTRTDAIVGVGGGAVTDLAGFAAATWLRGVRVVHLPTTLLGMVDAAIGGKTAVNTAAGKNLVGSFHQPAGVLCDLDALATLPRADFVAGMAEVVKAGFISDPEIAQALERGDGANDGTLLHELVVRAVRVKADVVAADPGETGRREFLNYGHTLAHAIERDAGFGAWRHGDAVSVGLVFAAELGRLAGRLDDASAARHRSILSGLGLPTRYDADAWPRLRDAMRVDKKSRGARLRVVVLEGVGRPVILDDPPEELLEAAYAEVSE